MQLVSNDSYVSNFEEVLTQNALKNYVTNEKIRKTAENSNGKSME